MCCHVPGVYLFRDLFIQMPITQAENEIRSRINFHIETTILLCFVVYTRDMAREGMKAFLCKACLWICKNCLDMCPFFIAPPKESAFHTDSHK